MALTAITLGNFFTTSTGKNVFGGAGGSGLDTQSIITALTNAQKVGATQDQTQITNNNNISTALSQLQSLLTTFQSTADALRSPLGVNAAGNAFALTTASMGNGGSAYVTATTATGATPQTYNISAITSIASAASQASGTFNIASPDADATTGAVSFTPGTITFASGATVTINAGDSLNTIVGNFNAVSSQTGIAASIIQIDSTHYQISFNATKTGTAANFDLTSAGTVTSGEASLSTIGLGAAVAGTDAKFKVNGVAIDRQSNIVSDVISGVTLNIQQKTPDSVTNYPLTISPDTATIQNDITSFVNAYNALKAFQTQQTQLNSDGTYASTSVLVNNPTFQSIMDQVNQAVDTTVAGIQGSDPSSLSQVGITFTNQAATSTSPEVDNILTINSSQLSSALASNFTGVKNVFGLNVTSTNSNFLLASHTLPIGVTDFTVNIDPSSSTYTASYTLNGVNEVTNLTATPQGGGLAGYVLTGAPGSALDGATFIYGSNSSSTFTVHVSQGVAEQAYTSSTAALYPNTGTLAVAINAIQTSNAKLDTDIAVINNQANVFQQQLLQKFAALESAIASSNNLLQLLNANSNSALIASGH